MTQKQKELLLKDLCARLPYGVKIAMPGLWDHKITIEPLNEIFKGDDDLFRVNGNGHCIEYIKPYLFPMSSMTEEQQKEYRKVCDLDMTILENCPMKGEPFPAMYNSQDWLDAHYFDYRGLIPMGLANDATNLKIY